MNRSNIILISLPANNSNSNLPSIYPEMIQPTIGGLIAVTLLYLPILYIAVYKWNVLLLGSVGILVYIWTHSLFTRGIVWDKITPFQVRRTDIRISTQRKRD